MPLPGETWAAIYTAVSYLGGTWLQQTSGIINLALGAAAVAAVIAVWLLVRRQAGRLAERAEQAYPGPPDDHQAITGAGRGSGRAGRG